jgi:hypothetical protein
MEKTMIPENFQKHRRNMIDNPVDFVQEYLMPIKKKRGRPKMEETFFYDPNETEKRFLMGIDTVYYKDRNGYVTNLIGNNTVEFNWQITYKE